MLKPLPPRPARGTRFARALALFALVVMVEAVLARRFDLIDTPTLFVALIAVAMAALLALAVVVVSLGDVWRDGAPGAGRALVAFGLVVLVLAPFAGAAAAVAIYPPVFDVTTDPVDPPRFRTRPDLGDPLVGLTDSPAEAARLVTETWPDIATRNLPLSTVEAHAASHLAATELGWMITAEAEPAGEADAGVIEAEARSLFLGVPDDVVVRILPAAIGSRVDVRSASRFPTHDLGENARRIRAFFAKLAEITTRPATG
jgi:hypothetical protein